MPSVQPRLTARPVARGFAAPVYLAAPPDSSGRLFVVDQPGLIRVIDQGQLKGTPFLDIRERIVRLSEFYDERGLLGLAFHPDYAHNGRFFVYYSGPLRPGLSSSEWDHTSYLSEFKVSSQDPDRADPASERVLLAVDKPGYNYEGGQLAFGPDGYLYLAMGDSARHPDREVGGYAQSLDSLLGKILRIDVDHGNPYGIPLDNPFARSGGRPEIFAYGFRNPYRFSFDPGGDHLLLAGDVGHAVMEEVDLVKNGGDYGWPIREGTTCFNASNWVQPLESCPSKGPAGEALLDPVIAYRHGDGLSAVIGGLVYRGSALPGLYGAYLFGDWGRGQGRLFAADLTPGEAGPWPFREIQVDMLGGQPGLGQLLAIGQDAGGKVYLLLKDPQGGPVGDSGQVVELIHP